MPFTAAEQQSEGIETGLSRYVDLILFFNKSQQPGLVYCYRFKLKKLLSSMEIMAEPFFGRRPIRPLPEYNCRSRLQKRTIDDLNREANRISELIKTFITYEEYKGWVGIYQLTLNELLAEMEEYRKEIERLPLTLFPNKNTDPILCPIRRQAGWRER
ncbi:MAG: hypothetical protein OYG31_00045 [Candidatus Kaiserbacteria bacterium]|nr:hypothetical protein [Candidatus Kaiserbacteria bacterium]